MKKTKRRYESHTQIIDEIERYKVKMQRLLERSLLLESKAMLLVLQNDGRWNEDIALKRKEAAKLRRSAFRIENHKLPYLKQKLAEFNTELLPGTGITDRSIQA